MEASPASDRSKKALFLRSFPPGILRDLIVEVPRVYRDSARELRSSFSNREEVHDLLPHFRRAKMEDRFGLIGARHPSVMVQKALNAAKNSYHTILRSGSFVFTQHYCAHHAEVVRPAVFREEYARRAQIELFSQFNEDVPLTRRLESVTHYAILQHGPDPEDPALPGYVHVKFPNAACDGYVGKIDLLLAFGALGVRVSEEVVAADPMLRPRRKSEEGGA